VTVPTSPVIWPAAWYAKAERPAPGPRRHPRHRPLSRPRPGGAGRRPAGQPLRPAPATRVPGMRLAQRARDAAMALGVAALPERPAILVAGNGHVRVTTASRPLARLRPAPASSTSPSKKRARQRSPTTYTHLWITPAVQRDDPARDSPPRS
jgi:hypothetical protein